MLCQKDCFRQWPLMHANVACSIGKKKKKERGKKKEEKRLCMHAQVLSSLLQPHFSDSSISSFKTAYFVTTCDAVLLLRHEFGHLSLSLDLSRSLICGVRWSWHGFNFNHMHDGFLPLILSHAYGRLYIWVAYNYWSVECNARHLTQTRRRSCLWFVKLSLARGIKKGKSLLYWG